MQILNVPKEVEDRFSDKFERLDWKEKIVVCAYFELKKNNQLGSSPSRSVAKATGYTIDKQTNTSSTVATILRDFFKGY